MKITRRNFLKFGATAVAAASLPLTMEFLDPAQVKASIKKHDLRWGFLVDTYKCVGCGMCVKACKLENEVPYDAPVTRTWVERYVLLKDGRLLADTPNGGRDGFTSRKIRKEEFKDKDIVKGFFVPKLCNQCEKPPCVQVCPVGATYQVESGIVLVDRTWCIGCGYCIMACPYGARFFHPKYKVAEKCTFCIHRLSKGMNTACVDACPFGARQVGNLKDPNDPITKIITTRRVGILRSEYGTKPQVYYIGLDDNVR
ncbi:tetrathionate reductase subunit B precursor [bacterium BMS3Abin07]|nr:tetrathionate reductase subunit B precursor [bacterium BMS3Abin07]HDL20663.1 4Fe-4S dicluster domain-containing protein [Nitrospirota bacterium]HDO23055.1 4Fe-4S dicluster domain-containing protein [Nitrospirota bacterium]HDZ87279.1 4Fe-4S dicluster domain-containing protein [Nitrospirota bacterium]